MAQSSSSAPDFFAPEKRHSSDHFIVDDLLNFPSDDTDDHHHDLLPPAMPLSADSSVVTTNSTVEGPRRTLDGDAQFSHDLCDPYDAELEWLSNFVEESFSSTDLEKLHLLSGVRSQPIDVSETHQLDHDIDTRNTNSVFNTDMTVPAKARTKRSRGAPRSWTSRLVLSGNPTTMVSSESESDISSSLTSKKSAKSSTKKKDDDNESHSGEGRRCLHCATDKTPQWRTGPLGPKTLCNACGVRYKSGRLVPEYRPASSPTFVLTKHSNSHRKVLELRRQKETQSAHQLPFFHHQNMMFDVSKGEDYLIHQHIDLDYRQLI